MNKITNNSMTKFSLMLTIIITIVVIFICSNFINHQNNIQNSKIPFILE